jgi:hypothetical protein
VVVCRGASKEGAIPVSHSRVSEVWSRGIQFTNSRDRESQKVLALRPGLWSCGGKTHTWCMWCRWSFHEGPVDRIH